MLAALAAVYPTAYSACAIGLPPKCDRCYCLASGAARTWRQAAGNCASVGPRFGSAGSGGGLGWITSSLNQKARSAALQASPSVGAGWLSQVVEPDGHLIRMWK